MENLMLPLKSICISLRKRIFYKIFLLFLFAISVPASFILFLSYNMSNSMITSDFIEYKKNMCFQIVGNIDENIGRMQDGSAALLLNLSDIRDFLTFRPETIDNTYYTINKKIDAYLMSILSNNDRYDGIGLIDTDGDMAKYANWDGFLPVNFTLKNEYWIKETNAAKGSPVLHTLDINDFIHNNSEKGRKVIAVTRTINDYNNSNIPIGLSIFCQSVLKFGELASKGCVAKDETISIIGNDGNIIYSNKKVSGSMANEVLNLFKTREEISGKYCMDNEWYYVFSNYSSKTGFKVVLIIPEYILEQKMSSVQKINIFLIAFITLSIILMSIFLSNIITNPLKRLISSFRKLEKGDLDTSVAVKGNDEFAEICKGFNTMVQNIKKLINQKYELDMHRRQAELESLQSKINPHFLYNTLSLMKAAIERKDFNNTRHIVQDLSDIFRYSLNKGNFLVSFSEEYEHIQKYLSIQKLRFVNRFETVMDIDEEIMQCKILRLTLQPIVENAIIHGLESVNEAGRISISAKLCKDDFYIYISDNGVGIPEEKVKEMNKIFSENPETNLNSISNNKVGIYNVNSRIKLYFGEKYGIRVSSCINEGTTVRIALPFEREINDGRQ